MNKLPSGKSLTSILVFSRMTSMLACIITSITLYIVSSSRPTTLSTSDLTAYIVCAVLVAVGCLLQLGGFLSGLTTFNLRLNLANIISNTVITIIFSLAMWRQWSAESIYLVYGLARKKSKPFMKRKRDDAAEPVMNDDPTLLATLSIGSLHQYRRQGVPYQHPVEIACFSYDAERKVHMDDRELKYFYPPTLSDHQQCNLSAGYPELFRERDESTPEYLDALLESLQHIRPQLERDDANNCGSNRSVIGPPGTVVTWRGIMTKILCTPYNSNESWIFSVCRVNGVIYLVETSESRANSSTPINDRHARMIFWGYRFESLATIDCNPREVKDPYTDPRVTDRHLQQVNTNIQYCSVVKTKLGQRQLVLGGEVDCQLDDKVPNDPSRNYLELKTHRIIPPNNPRLRRTFEQFKLLKIYIQSFLLAIPRVLIGFRNDAGILKSMEVFETLQIPRMVRQQGYWDPNVCLNFADHCLQFIEQHVVEDDGGDSTVVYQLRYYPDRRAIELSRLPAGLHEFIPKNYNL